MAKTAKRSLKWPWLVAALLVLWGIRHLPFGYYLLYPLVLFDTVTHEMGHGLAAMLVGGHFQGVDLNIDGSGLAHSSNVPAGWHRAVTAAGGLLGPPIAAAIAFTFGRSYRGGRTFLVGLGLFLAVSLLVFIKFSLAWLVIAGLTLLFLGAGFAGPDVMVRLTTLAVACELAILVFTRSDYLFTKSAVIAGQTLNSDVQNVAISLFGPYWMWGGLIGLLSLLVLVFGLQSYLVEEDDEEESAVE